MKVKIAELKTHLSRYVRELRQGAEPIEVCVRESTVAYLTAADADSGDAGADTLVRDLEHAGLEVSQWSVGRRGELPLPVAGRTRRRSNAVLKMRSEKDW